MGNTLYSGPLPCASSTVELHHKIDPLSTVCTCVTLDKGFSASGVAMIWVDIYENVKSRAYRASICAFSKTDLPEI